MTGALAEIAQAVTAGVVAGGCSIGGVFWWARSVGQRLDGHDEQLGGPTGLDRRVTVLEQQSSTTAKAVERIEAAVAAVHRRLDEHQQSDQADRLAVARSLGELTAEMRRVSGRG